MNIRSLLLASIIFCAAPVFCLTSEEGLTKDEQEALDKFIAKEKLTEQQQDDIDEFIKVLDMEKSLIFNPENNISYMRFEGSIMTYETPLDITEAFDLGFGNSYVSFTKVTKKDEEVIKKEGKWVVIVRDEELSLEDEEMIKKEERAKLKETLTFMLDHLDSLDIVLQHEPESENN